MRPVPSFVYCISLMVIVGFAMFDSARADQTLNCDAYATSAVKHQQTNQKLECGFSGGAWSTDFQGHRNWCLSPTVKMADLTREYNARKNSIWKCGVKSMACDNYAELARVQNQENLRRRCGLTAGRWSDDVNGHRRWCMIATFEQAVGETSVRHEELARCSRQMATTGFKGADQKAQEYMEMFKNVIKTLHDTSKEIARKVGQ